MDLFGLLGTTIKEQYRIDAVVGEGGFGVVYRGFHLSFERPIAIKCLKVPPHFTAEAQKLFHERFREEGRLLSMLSDHPSIVKVFDFGITKSAAGGGVPYLVLEWLDGQELGHVLRDRGVPFSEKEALQLLRPAVDAIALAHSLGIAHRDLKPANLILAHTARGQMIKVLDFGIAKAMQEGETATQLATRTTSGFNAFSPQYGAPEQFLSKKYGPTGPWTDVHALALILVHLVSGRPPYEGETAFETIGDATSPSRPTPRMRGAQVSDQLESVCARALAPMAKDRYADASQLLAALDAIAPQLGGAQAGAQPYAAPFQPHAPPQPAAATMAMPPSIPTYPNTPQGTFSPALVPAPAASTVSGSTEPRGSNRRMGVGGVLGLALAFAACGGVVWFMAFRKADASKEGQASPSGSGSAQAAGVNTWVRITGAPSPIQLGFSTFPAATALGYRPGEVPPSNPGTFYIQAREVSRGEFAKFDTSVSVTSAADRMLPATGISWRQAQRYCLEVEHGRLPTDAEWELAVRGPDGSQDPWSGGLQLNQGRDSPFPVMDPRLDRIQREGQTLIGFGGNVLEWTSDTWQGAGIGEWTSENPSLDKSAVKANLWKFVSVRGRAVFERDRNAAQYAAFARRPVCALDGCERRDNGFLRVVSIVPDGEPTGVGEPFARAKLFGMVADVEKRLSKKADHLATCTGEPGDSDVEHDFGLMGYRSWRGKLTADVWCAPEDGGSRDTDCYFSVPERAGYTAEVVLDASGVMECVTGSPKVGRFTSVLGKDSVKDAIRLFSKPSIPIRVEVRTFFIGTSPIVDNVGFRCARQSPPG